MAALNNESDDFYIGYRKHMPNGLARFTARSVALPLGTR